MFLTLALVGSFYAVFSIFIRSLFPVSECLNVNSVASILENAYLVILFTILLVSTTRKVDKSEMYYQVSAAVLGSFMAVSSLILSKSF